MMITSFEHFDGKKALEVLVWIAVKAGEVDQFRASKICYFADKWHLNEHGRPIIGDKYSAMKYGPVPSHIYNLIKKEKGFVDSDIYEDLKKSIQVSPGNDAPNTKKKKITALREPDLDYLSGSDVYFLEKAFNYCKDKGFAELSRLSHDKAWKNNEGKIMNYEDMVDDDNPHRQEIIEEVRDNAKFLAFSC